MASKKGSGPKLKYARVTAILGPGVAAYTWLKEPDDKFDADNPKYKLTLVVPNDFDMTGFEAKAVEVARSAWGEKAIKSYASLTTTVKDGDEKTRDGKPMEEFAGKLLLGTKSGRQPLMIDAKKNPLPEGIFPGAGDLVKIKVQFIPHTAGGSKSVALRLLTVQVLEKRAGGGDDSDGFDEEDGFDGSTAKAPANKPKSKADEDAGDGDEDF
jgi:hypothetical protein